MNKTPFLNTVYNGLGTGICRSFNTVVKRLITNAFIRLQKNRILVKLLTYYCIFVLTIRGFFIKDEYPEIVYLIVLIIGLVKLSGIVQITVITYLSLWFYSGLFLIGYDQLGSLIARFAETNPTAPLTVSLLTIIKTPTTNFIKRYSFTSTAYSMIVGTTKMSSTGRASIVVALTSGLIAGTGYIFNEHLNRVHDEMLQGLNRAHDETQQGLNREVQREQIAVEDKKANIEQGKLDFDQRKYNDTRAAQLKATQSWWSSLGK
jgi:uncharacterized membrane protein